MNKQNNKTMTPKEKAIQLIEQFQTDIHSDVLSLEAAQECAKLLSIEVLNQYTHLNADLIDAIYRSEKVVYWGSVINEIENYEKTN